MGLWQCNKIVKNFYSYDAIVGVFQAYTANTSIEIGSMFCSIAGRYTRSVSVSQETAASM